MTGSLWFYSKSSWEQWKSSCTGELITKGPGFTHLITWFPVSLRLLIGLLAFARQLIMLRRLPSILKIYMTRNSRFCLSDRVYKKALSAKGPVFERSWPYLSSVYLEDIEGTKRTRHLARFSIAKIGKEYCDAARVRWDGRYKTFGQHRGAHPSIQSSRSISKKYQKKFYVQITVVLPGTIALIAPVISIFGSVGLSQIHL